MLGNEKLTLLHDLKVAKSSFSLHMEIVDFFLTIFYTKVECWGGILNE